MQILVLSLFIGNVILTKIKQFLFNINRDLFHLNFNLRGTNILKIPRCLTTEKGYIRAPPVVVRHHDRRLTRYGTIQTQ